MCRHESELSRQPFVSGHWPTLVGAWLHLTVSFMVWLLFGGTGRGDWECVASDRGQQGVLVALLLLSGPSCACLTGWSCDWFGAKRTGLLVLGLELVAILWAALGGTSFVELLGIALLLGPAGLVLPSPCRSPVGPIRRPSRSGSWVGGIREYRDRADPSAGSAVGANVGMARGLREFWPALLRWSLVCLRSWSRKSCGKALLQGEAGGTRPGDDACDRWRGCAWFVDYLRRVCRLTSFLPVLLHDHYGSDPILAGSMAALCGLVEPDPPGREGGGGSMGQGVPVLAGVFVLLALITALAGSPPALPWALAVLVVTIAVGMGFGNGVIFQIVGWFHGRSGWRQGLVGAAEGIGGFLIADRIRILREGGRSFCFRFGAWCGQPWR